MAELTRPLPERSVATRARAWVAVLSPVRVASGAAAVLLVAVTAWWLLAAPPAPVERSLPRATGGAAATTRGAPAASTAAGSMAPAAPTPSTPSTVVVHVTGAVARPGVLRLPAGARVADAVDAAGGPTADADLAPVNLAARLSDGQRVALARVGDPPAAGAAASPDASTPSPDEPVDLNTATTTELEALPGIGPATAAAILEARTRLGRFTRVEDLLEVRGIGPARLEALRARVRV
jgi:competence protein ComEA